MIQQIKMKPPNLLWSSRLVVVVMSLICSEAMHYQEPFNTDDLDKLFGEDGCIDGTLSAVETGSPLISPVSFVESEPPSTLKNRKTNVTDVFEEKSPMSLISELATFNKIKHHYTLTDEGGPAHKKSFYVTLNLGEEQYNAEGSSIKKAQHEAARLALNSTLYGHPPKKPKTDKPIKLKSTTPVQKLNEWASKHGDTKVTYSFIQQSRPWSFSDHGNHYHKGLYLKPENVYKVTVKVESQTFTGEAPSAESAKQEGAAKALKQLQEAEGFCMFEDSVKDLFSRLFSPSSENYTPVSLVHEFASKSKQPVSFDLISEEGPSHLKRFVFKCSIGEKIETFGEGSSKKSAKKEAAESMIQKLKSQASYNEVNCGGILKKKKKSQKKSRNLTKSVKKSNFEEEEENFIVPENKDPISKLIEIQQKKHDLLPLFRLVEEKGNTLKEFYIEVSVGELTFVGSGPNKKTAKKKAAEGMLEKLGYSTSGPTRSSSSKSNRKEFVEDSSTKIKKTLLPGVSLNSEKVFELDNSNSNDMKEKHSDTKHTTMSKPKAYAKDKPTDTERSKKTSSGERPKKQFAKLALELGFRYQFSDFPKGNNTGFVSLVSLATDPPKVCYGTGTTTEQSQDMAALTALQALHKNQVDLISKLLKERTSTAPSKQQFPIVDKDVLRTIIDKQTE